MSPFSFVERRSRGARAALPAAHRGGVVVVAAQGMVLLGLCAAGAGAQGLDDGSQSLWIRSSIFHAQVHSSLRIDDVGSPELGLPGTDTSVDFERTLGLPEHQTRVDLTVGARLFERGRIELQHYSLNRSGTRQVLDESIVVNGVTYSAQAQLQTRFDTEVTRLVLGYSVWKSDRVEAGLLLGAQYTSYRLQLVGVGSVNNEPPVSAGVEERDSGPLPTVGAYVAIALAPDWSLHAHADYLPLDSRRLRGRLGVAELNVLRRLGPHLSVGLGLRHAQYQVDRKSSGERKGSFAYRFTAPQLMLQLGF